MRLAWLTDIHLNFLDDRDRAAFLRTAGDGADALAIAGDLAESPTVVAFLREIDAIVRKPVYFVLGNHDFYKGSSIAATRVEVAQTARESGHLHYLTNLGVVELSPRTAMVGHDGWADGRLGDYENSNVLLSDFYLIPDLARWNVDNTLDKRQLLETLQELAEEAAAHFEKVLAEAVCRYDHVVAVTHVPPFREAAWYDGKPSNDDFLPHFACKATGEVMERIMRANPQCDLLVLCGHTHGGGEVQVLDNLRVLTGAAHYHYPVVQQILEIK